jgi:hypothetical protein
MGIAINLLLQDKWENEKRQETDLIWVSGTFVDTPDDKRLSDYIP